MDNLPEQMRNFNKERETVKESNGNVSYNKHDVTDEKLLWQAHQHSWGKDVLKEQVNRSDLN